ncbi:MAG: hypothetical protein ACFCU6_08235, partial [Balneolaceae bacterium]
SDWDKVEKHFNDVFKGKPNTEVFRLKTKTGNYIQVIDYAKPEWDTGHNSVISVKGAASIEISSEKKS